jgi:nucleotidyltransferase substrate binding protein (TIGR01987 family)
MSQKPLQLDELKKALEKLKEALALDKTDIVRDSIIKRFEFTVELSWKALQRFLSISGISEVLTPKNVFREGSRLGLVDDPEAWIRFVDARNLSSHTYKESLAEEVCARAREIPTYVQELIHKIENGL